MARYCVACGDGLVATAAICPRCGTPVSGWTSAQLGAKPRAVAVVLAVFLSFWSFLYTYKAAPWKFWLGLGLALFAFVLLFAGGATKIAPFAVLGVLIPLGVWIWAIIDRSITAL